jgi:hypothetical protein
LGGGGGAYLPACVKPEESIMPLRYTGLDAEQFHPLFALSDADLSARNILKLAAEPGSPCRVSLEDAVPGERVLLLPFEHHPVATPYRASGPIFVRENAGPAYDAAVPPPAFHSRMLSLRAYDESGLIVEAVLCAGTEVDAACTRLLASGKAAYIHAHYAKYGCYGALVRRADDEG